MEDKNMLKKNCLIGLIYCMLVIVAFLGVAEANEEAAAEQPKEEVQVEEHEYILIEKEKTYMLNSRETFLYYCSPCHGEYGNGKGMYFTIDLQPSPRDLTDVEYMAALTDDYLKNFISNGSAAMEKSDLCPPWGNTLDEGAIKGIITYLRGLTIAKSKEDGASEGGEEAEKVAVVKDKGTPQAVIWSVLIFLCAFFAIGAVREWKKLAKEGASEKK